MRVAKDFTIHLRPEEPNGDRYVDGVWEDEEGQHWGIRALCVAPVENPAIEVAMERINTARVQWEQEWDNEYGPTRQAC